MKLLNIVILLFLAALFSGCLEYEDVDFKGVQKFGVENRTSEQILIRLDIKVDNPNTYNITIKPATLDIYINGKYAGKTKMKEKIVLQKKTTGVYPLYLQAKTKDIMSALTGSLGAMLSGKVKVGIKGNVKAKAYGIGKKFYLNEEQTVSLKGLMQ